MPTGSELAQEYHLNLPQRIRDYLREGRGIDEAVIDRNLLGWNGSRITIPIFDREGRLALFKFARDPEDIPRSPKMLATPGAHAELYGWERVLTKPEQIIVCEGEFDRLVLESHGFPAVTSTGGAGNFRPEWAEALVEIPKVYVCFDHDEAGRAGAERVARLIPQARIVQLPEEVGENGDITDFFVRLKKTNEEFLVLLEAARPLPQSEHTPQPDPQTIRAISAIGEEIDTLKSLVAVEDVIGRYVQLRASGQNLVGRCPFHKDRDPSFVVYPRTRSFCCFGCRENGDVIAFLMRMEHLSFREAIKVLREFTC